MDTPTLVVDEREKKPYQFSGIKTTESTLDVGDYTIEGLEDVFAIERKSLNDLARSVGSDRTRFEDEIRRARGLASFVVVVEGTIEDIQNGDFWGQMHPNSILGTCQKWPAKYDNLEFRFYEDRQAAQVGTLNQLDEWWLEYLRDVV